VVVTSEYDVSSQIEEIEKDISKLKHDFRNDDNNTPKSAEERNEEIKKKYEIYLPELLPSVFRIVKKTKATIKKIKNIKTLLKRRRDMHFKAHCARRHNIIEKWLTNKLRQVQRQSMKQYHSNCTRKNKKVSSDIQQHDMSSPQSDVSTLQFCDEKGELDQDGSMTMCPECYMSTDLGQRKFPRFINQVRCGNRNEDDLFCFAHEGLCVENLIYVTFLYDANRVGFNRLYQWLPYQQPIATACSCQLLRNSYFSSFIL